MKKMNAAAASLMKDSFRKILFSNPVLVGGMVVGEIIIGATSLQNAGALSVTFAIVTIPVLLLAPLIAYFVPKTWRILCYALVSMSMLFTAQAAVAPISPTIFDSLGIYLPLLALNTVVVAYSRLISEEKGVVFNLLDGICFSLGFLIVAVLIGGLRELFGSGTLWGYEILQRKASALKLPFSGFLIAGFLAAAVEGLRILFHAKPYEHFSGGKEDQK